METEVQYHVHNTPLLDWCERGESGLPFTPQLTSILILYSEYSPRSCKWSYSLTLLTNIW